MKKKNKKLNKKLIFFQIFAISIFLLIFVFDFDNRLSANKRRACDRFFAGDIEFIELKQLWKPKEENQSKLYKKYFEEWVSWQKLGDTTNEITGENICNSNRYKKQKNRPILYQLLVFAFVYLFLYGAYDIENY